MKKRKSQDGLIASESLNSAHIPPDGAEFEVIETFCLTIDGYQSGKHSIDDLLRDADRVERAGIENATLDELRTAAFIRQREYRWSTDQGQENEPLRRKICELVGEIRRRVRD